MKKNKLTFNFVIGFLILLLLTIGVFSAGFYFYISERESMEERISGHRFKANLIKQMYHASRERHIMIWKASITSDSFKHEEILEAFNQQGSNFISAANSLKETDLNIEEQSYVKLLDRTFQGPGIRGRALLDQILREEDITHHLLAEDNPFERQDKYLKVLEMLSEYQNNSVDRIRSETEDRVTEIIIFMSLSLLLIFSAGGILSFLSIRKSGL